MDESDLRLEFFVEPFTEGRPGPHVAAAIEAVASRGLEVQVGPFGSVAHGELGALVDAAGPLLRSALSSGADRISLHITTRSDPQPGKGSTSLHNALSRMIAEVLSGCAAATDGVAMRGTAARTAHTTVRGRRTLARLAVVADGVAVHRVVVRAGDPMPAWVTISSHRRGPCSRAYAPVVDGSVEVAHDRRVLENCLT